MPELKRSAPLALCAAFLLVMATLIGFAAAAPAARAASAASAVTTFKNDNQRDGQFAGETALNESDVNVTQFGKRVQYSVDGQVYAEPLFLPNLSVGGGTHNVVFVATENDSVYAFDADATSAVAPLWKVSLLPGGATAVSSNVSGCGDLTPEIGITGTPVIDPSTGTLFVVSYDTEGGNQVYRLHALNVLTGADKWPAIVISASVPGTGVGSSGGTISFNPTTNRQRPNLLLENGKVYVGFSSFCDIGAYHGWILSYSFSTTAFTLAGAYADTPNGSDGGIWSGSGGAIAGDPNGNVYYLSGNGTFDANTGGPDYGDSFVRLNGSLQVQDYFTPYNQQCLSGADQDLGAGGLLVIPSANVVMSAGKEGRVYVDSTTSMGKFTNDPNLACGGTDSASTTIDKVQQELPPGTVGSLFSTPALWTGPSGQDIYFTQVNGPTREFSWSGGKLSTAPTSASSANGGDPVVSSNGTAAGTAIVWNQDFGGELHAYDPTNLAHEYWNSGMNSGRDGLPGEVKYATPTVANGEVFVGLPAGLAIFGLLSSTPPPPPPSSLQINAGGSAASPFVADEDFSGGATAAVTNAISTTGVTSPAPQAVYQSNRYGNFSYAVGGYTAGATETIRLHFAEEYWTTAGSRVFNVFIDGTQVLTNFDIFAAAGGEYKAVVSQFSVTVPSGGTITLQFAAVKDNAQVNGIEILSGGSGPPPPPPSSTQISAGGPASGTWAADEDFTGGATAAVTNAISTTGVTNPAPQSVYQHNRYGNFSYAIPGLTAGHAYTIRLHFAEEYWTTAGSRVFNVLIDGTQVLTNFDIFAAAGGEYKAVVSQFSVTAPSNGTITLQFATVKDNAQVNGIEILS
ncbi:MAG TPA: malectin domain-containing carbohydrate-binding protein [Streptosporangiaceae bacterium]|nr:malectin domain-containing carbohydrate-binding protein [Streptosporangiaceae bacterium]